MATEAALGKRRAEAMARIERKCEALAGGRALVLPTTLRYGADTLLVLQLEAIADYLDGLDMPVPVTTTTRRKNRRGRETNA